MSAMTQATPERPKLQPPSAGSPGSAFSSIRQPLGALSDSPGSTDHTYFSRVSDASTNYSPQLSPIRLLEQSLTSPSKYVSPATTTTDAPVSVPVFDALGVIHKLLPKASGRRDDQCMEQMEAEFLQHREPELLRQQMEAEADLRALAEQSSATATLPAPRRLDPPPGGSAIRRESSERSSIVRTVPLHHLQSLDSEAPIESNAGVSSNHAVMPESPMTNMVGHSHACIDETAPRVSNNNIIVDNEARGNDEWDAVDTVSSSVNVAFGKLKDLATPYIGGVAIAGAGGLAPELINISTESSSSPSYDSEHGSSGFDLKELEAELRAPRIREEQSSERSLTISLDSDKGRDMNASAISFDTVGIQKPATLAQSCPVPHHTLKKPVPLPLSQSILLANSNPDPETNTDESAYRAALQLSRAVTPIMRMRNHSKQEEMATMETSDEAQITKNESKKEHNEEEYKALKQKKWKKKINHMNKQREEEKSTLLNLESESPNHGVATSQSATVKDNDAVKETKPAAQPRKEKRKQGGSRRRRPRPKPKPAASAGRGNLIETVEKFLLSRCGNLEDALFNSEEVSEDDDDSMDGSDSDSDDETETDTLTRGTSADFSDSDGSSNCSASRTTVESKSVKSKPKSAKSKVGNKKSATHGKIFIREFTTDMTKEGIPLLLHKQIRNKALNRPTQIIASFQLGGADSGDGSFGGPKLVWNAVDNEGENGNADLFDIRSLNKATALQLENYPLAMPGRSLFLRVDNAEYVFETKNEEEALRFVHGMRWVIARLSYNLIIGDLSVSCELLDVDRTSSAGRREAFPSTREEESKWTSAMDDVACHLVDKAAKV